MMSVLGLKLIKMQLLTCQPTVLFYINQAFISNQAQLVYKGNYPFPPFSPLRVILLILIS